jgi:hypothetical protein
MVASSYWSVACSDAFNRPRSDISAAIDSSCATTVSTDRPLQTLIFLFEFSCSVLISMLSFLTVFNMQIAVFLICAVLNGFMRVHWHRLQKEEKSHLWPLYGWFTGFACIGSLLGVFLVSVAILHRRNLVEVFDEIHELSLLSSMNVTEAQQIQLLKNSESLVYLHTSRNLFYGSVLIVPEGFQIYFLTMAKMMVLDRITRAALSSTHGLPFRWQMFKRSTMVFILMLLSISFSCRLVVGYFFGQLAPLYEEAAAFILDDKSLDDFQVRSEKIQQQIHTVYTVSNICESIALIYIVFVFLLIAGFCAGRIKRILHSPGAPTAADPSSFLTLNAELKIIMKQVVATCFIVFLSLVSMAFVVTVELFTFIEGVGECGDAAVEDFCDPCHATNEMIYLWFIYTPEFTILGFYFPSPLALLVALWAMTSKRLLLALKRSRENPQMVILPPRTQVEQSDTTLIISN